MASLEYSTDLFAAATIERMPEHFQTVLESVVADPEQRCQRLPLMPVAENSSSCWSSGMTHVEYGRANTCDQNCSSAQVARTPRAVAVIFEDEQLTYRELNDARIS